MLDYAEVAALVAVDDAGTIEGAARRLRISSFAGTVRQNELETERAVS